MAEHGSALREVHTGYVSSWQHVSLDRDAPDLARAYEQTGVIQLKHGKFLFAPLKLRTGENVFDIGSGTGRLAEFVASLVGPSGSVIGIHPLPHRKACTLQEMHRVKPGGRPGLNTQDP